MKTTDVLDREELGVGLSQPVANVSLRDLAEEEANQIRKVTVQAQHIPQTAIGQFPNLALEIVNLTVEKERFMSDQVNRHLDQIQKKQDAIGLLLDLNAELSGAKDEGGEGTSEKAKEILARLKNDHAIDLKGNIAEIKHNVSLQEGRLRTEMQILFTTKVQISIQQIETIISIAKDIIRKDEQLKRATGRLPGH